MGQAFSTLDYIFTAIYVCGPTPYTLHPTPYTLGPKPRPRTLGPKTLKSRTLDPKTQTTPDAVVRQHYSPLSLQTLILKYPRLL